MNEHKKKRLLRLLNDLLDDAGDNRLRSGEYMSDSINVILDFVSKL